MSKIKIKQGDCKAPQALAKAIVVGQAFPFTAKLLHKGRKPLVVPSTGIVGLIPPGKAVDVKIKNADQAWLLVTDLATYARLSGSAEDFAEIEVPEVPEEPEIPEGSEIPETSEVAEDPAPVVETPAKPAKAGKNEGVKG